jgi:hypothetical protein
MIRQGKQFCSSCGTPVAAGYPQPSPPPAPQQAPQTGGGERFWNIASLAGCGIVSAGWLFYSGMAETKPDYLSCAAIVLLPLALQFLRSDVDRLLQPIHRVLRYIPGFLRLGIALGIPYLTAHFLYAKGFSNFDYMQKTVVWAPLLSYILLRVPRPAGVRA